MSPSSPLPGIQSTPTALILAYKQEQQTDADWIELNQDPGGHLKKTDEGNGVSLLIFFIHEFTYLYYTK